MTRISFEQKVARNFPIVNKLESSMNTVQNLPQKIHRIERKSVPLGSLTSLGENIREYNVRTVMLMTGHSTR